MTAWIILLSALSATSFVIAFDWFIWVVLGALILVGLIKIWMSYNVYYKKNKNLKLDNKIKEQEIENKKGGE